MLVPPGGQCPRQTAGRVRRRVLVHVLIVGLASANGRFDGEFSGVLKGEGDRDR